MSIKDKTEQVLRDIYILLSDSEPYQKDESKVVVDKRRIVELLNQMSVCVSGMMDEYGISQSGRDKLERETKKAREEILRDANRQVEDIYAAAFLYTDEALRRALEIMQETTESVKLLCDKVEKDFQKEQESVKNNKMELRGQLRVFRDTDKYLKIIEEQNKALEREKKREKQQEEGGHYAKIKPEIKVNAAYFEKMGIPLEDGVVSENETGPGFSEKQESMSGRLQNTESKQPPLYAEDITEDDFADGPREVIIPEIRVNLDAEYFKWRDSGLQIEEENTDMEKKQDKRSLFARKRTNKTENTEN